MENKSVTFMGCPKSIRTMYNVYYTFHSLPYHLPSASGNKLIEKDSCFLFVSKMVAHGLMVWRHNREPMVRP